jgi:hypothetical protein
VVALEIALLLRLLVQGRADRPGRRDAPCPPRSAAVSASIRLVSVNARSSFDRKYTNSVFTETFAASAICATVTLS